MKNIINLIKTDNRLKFFLVIFVIVFGVLNYLQKDLKIGRFDVEVAHFIEDTRSIPILTPNFLIDSIAKEFKKTVIYPKQVKETQDRRVYYFVVAKTDDEIIQKGNEVLDYINKLTDEALYGKAPVTDKWLPRQFKIIEAQMILLNERALNYKKHLNVVTAEIKKYQQDVDNFLKKMRAKDFDAPHYTYYKIDPLTEFLRNPLLVTPDTEALKTITNLILEDVEFIGKLKMNLDEEVNHAFNKVFKVKPSMLKKPTIKRYSYPTNSLIALSFLASSLALITLIIYRRVLKFELRNRNIEK